MKRSVSSKTSKRKRQHSVEIPSKKRRQILSLSKFNEITHPNWQSICPNIDQILSNKHTQSGVYAHEIQLVQQELEALLSMALVRKSFLQSTTEENLRSTIIQHKQAENTYAQKRAPTKPLPPLVPLTNQRQNGPQMLLDRQVSINPVGGTRIDKIWTDLDAFYHRISSNDISTIENLVKFHDNFEDKLRQYKINYQNQNLTEQNIRKQLNEEDFHELIPLSETNSLTSHYLQNTRLERVRNQFSSRLSHLSLSRKSLTRISPRLHPTYLDERFKFVREYLADQHPIVTKRITHQRKKQHRQSLNIPIADEFESKLSTLITLVHECSMINQCALKRARLQSTNEQIWLKLDAIQHDLQILIGKIDSTGDEKLFHKLENLLKDELRLPPMEFN